MVIKLTPWEDEAVEGKEEGKGNNDWLSDRQKTVWMVSISRATDDMGDRIEWRGKDIQLTRMMVFNKR